jgi:hypothetical protein
VYFLEKTLDARLPLLYNMGMKYDLIELPGELIDLPECGACYDTGIIADEDVFCDCPKGESACEASDDFYCGDDSADERAQSRLDEMDYQAGIAQGERYSSDRQIYGDAMADEFAMQDELNAYNRGDY